VLAALPPSSGAVSICGADPPEFRRLAFEAFNGGAADVLVATDTAGEGLNLQRRCRVVIDMELPWNPMRLEQRIGRVDRFGQTRCVHARRLVHQGSIEERVLDRIRERRVVSEAEVARWVLEDKAVVAPTAWSPETASIPTAVAEAERLATRRRHRGRRFARHEHVLVRGMRDDATVIAVHRITFANALGNVIAEYPVAHIVAPDAVPRVANAVAARVGQLCDEIERQLTLPRLAVGNRITKIQMLLAANRARLVQRSLFDGRAEAAARRAEVTAARLQSALARRRDSLESPVIPDNATATLVAMWPSRTRDCGL
jgi:hypothetical protein